MSEGFEVKKIAQETLGEYLRAVREQHGLSVLEVSKKTDVLEKFIQALESGHYQTLPPDAYVQGFLKKLANLYGVSCEDLLDQYKKEKTVALQTAREKITPKKGWRALIAELSVTPKLISVGVAVLLASGAFFYIVVQVLSVNRTPNLTILEPSPNTVLSGSSVVFRGKTDPGVSLQINGQNLLVEADGSFSTTLSLASGQKDFRLVATNKFGKEKTESVSLRVDEPQVAGQITEKPSELIMEIEFTKQTTIIIEKDGMALPEEQVPSGAIKRIVATEEIGLTTSDAGSTKVKLNEINLGALGKLGQKLVVRFDHESLDLLQND